MRIEEISNMNQTNTETWQSLLDKYREWMLSEKQNTAESLILWMSNRYEVPIPKKDVKF